jgi:hypothetical protein
MTSNSEPFLGAHVKKGVGAITNASLSFANVKWRVREAKGGSAETWHKWVGLRQDDHGSLYRKFKSDLSEQKIQIYESKHGEYVARWAGESIILPHTPEIAFYSDVSHPCASVRASSTRSEKGGNEQAKLT